MAEADHDDDDAIPAAARAASRPTHPDDANPDGETAEQALQFVVDLHGPAMFYETDALRAELEARCPGSRSDIALLLIGLDEQVPQALLAVHADDDVAPLALRLERRLRSRRSLGPDEAAWVVGTWARVLRLWSVAAASDALRPIGRRTDGWPDAPASIETRAAATATAAAAADADRRAEGAGIAATEPGDHAAHDGDAIVAPVNRWYGIGGLIAAVVVVVAIVRYESAGTVPIAGKTVASASADTKAAAPAVVATPGPPVEPRIVGVTSSEPLVADGRQREVFVSLRTPHGAIDSVEARFVGGDQALWAPPSVVDVSSDPITDGRVPAGLIGLRSTKPLKATFEYVVTMADGTRSAPFTKELALAPIPTTPPTIENVVLPEAIVAGKPFKAVIAFKAGDAPVASIESAVVSGDVVEAPRLTPVASSPPTRDEGGMLRVAAVADRSPTTMQFTLLDADGVRSAAKRVVFDVAPAPRTVVRCRDADCDVGVLPLSRDATVHGLATGARDDERADQRGTRATGAVVPAVPRDRATSDKPSVPTAPPPRARFREGKLMPESAPIVDPSS